MHPARALLPLFFIALMPFGVFGEEPITPDPKALRGQIDRLIKRCKEQHKKATLGLFQEAFTLSISYGAPIYNQGDHEGCFKFYAQTMASLVEAFESPESVSPAALDTLQSMKSTLERVRKCADVDKNAWSLRYVFDKTQLASHLKEAEVKALVGMGSQFFKRGQYDEALDAFLSANTYLKELEDQISDPPETDARFATVVLANAYFAQKKFKEASNQALLALQAMPEWPEIKFDLRSLHKDPEEYENLMEDLTKASQKAPEDISLLFLIGYEWYFTGKKTAAKEQLSKVTRLDPEHRGANILLKQLLGGERPPPLAPKDPKKAGQDF